MKEEGIDFVKELHERYGLIDAVRIANEYLATPVREGNTEELQFREGVKEAMHILDTL